MRAREANQNNRFVGWFDLAGLACGILFIYALVGVAQQWTGPFRSVVQIDLSLSALPGYAFRSLVRGFVAYAMSLAFTIAYGYWAGHSKTAERVLIPLLDILQSVPVLGFLPGLVLALVSIFPDSNIGLELSCIIMIFTGQVWNMTFSFYASVKNVPPALRDVTRVYRLGRWSILKKLELPYAMNGLLWNSMLSMAGGWFFLMVVESFTLGDQNFRLPGLGSYMAVAIEEQQTVAIAGGMVAMVVVIVLVDRVLWAPLVVWSQRFRLESSPGLGAEDSLILSWLQRSNIVRNYYRLTDFLKKKFEPQEVAWSEFEIPFGRVLASVFSGLKVILTVGFLVGMVAGGYYLHELVWSLSGSQWLNLVIDTILTFVRVFVAVILGSLWTIPLGVFIGMNPKWTKRLQPVVQVIAAFPAPMLFPIITLLLLRLGIDFEFGSVVLMLVGSQWYILFNTISGASQIPSRFIELATAFNLKGARYWRTIILPAIFPSLVNGWITAAGGAWNASIVSEFVKYGDRDFVATGIGSAITSAAEEADFALLAAGIVTMITAIVLLNHFFWSRMYHLAETKYRMEEV